MPAAIGTRDQSVFTARITPAVVLSTASASKPTVFNDGTGNQQVLRSYAVIAQNTSTAPNSGKNITFELVTPPAQPLVKASFRKVTPDFPTPLMALPETSLPQRSSVARTIYVTSPVTVERPVVKVNVLEGGSVIATTYLNPNPFAPPLDDPLDPNDRIPSGELVDSIEVHTPDIAYRATSNRHAGD